MLAKLTVPNALFELPVEFELKNDGTEREVRARFTDSGVLANLYGQTIIGHEYPQYEHLFAKYTNEIVLDKEMLMNSFLPAREILNADDNLRLTFEIKEGNILFITKYLLKIFKKTVSTIGQPGTMSSTLITSGILLTIFA